MSFPEFDALVTHLPPESAYQTAVRDQFTDVELGAMRSDKHGTWSQTEMLLALLFDAIQMLTHIQIARGGISQDAPKPLARPGVSAPAGVIRTQDAEYRERVAELLGQIRRDNAHTEE